MLKKILLVCLLLSTVIYAKEVTVSILPQKYFVEKIVGDKIKVNVMVKPGSSPATYEPKVSQMKNLSKSDIYFSIDVPFEDVWLNRFITANKNMLVVDTAKGITKLEMEAHKHHDEEHAENKEEKHEDHEHDKHKDEKHDDHDEHEHTGLDPHIWLDPILVKTQAKNIYDAIIKIDAENKTFYTENYKKFLIELDILDKELKSVLKPYSHKAFMVFHPSWGGYFAKRYDLEQIAIEVEGKEPKPSQLVELVHEAKKHNIKIVFVAPQFSKKGARTISNNIKGNVVIINPLSFQWDKNLLKTAKEIAKSYK